MNQVVKISDNTAAALRSETVESVLIRGDLSSLRPDERSAYYLKVCESVGLNPLTKPFEYMTLNGKLVLYALRACTDQLRSIHSVSVVDLIETERDGVIIVTAKVRNGEGRTDMAKGAVTINGLKGDALANAIMKAETKAKRRATLSLCGLGFLDETELEMIPNASATKTQLPKKDAKPIYTKLQAELDAAKTRQDLETWVADNKERIAILPDDWQDILRLRYRELAIDLQRGEPSKAAAIGGDEDVSAWLTRINGKLESLATIKALETFWNNEIDPHLQKMMPDEQEVALTVFARHEARIKAVEQ